MKWDGTCEQIGEVDCSEMANWITAIEFKDWPQQHRVDDQLRPAMVSDPNWCGFGPQALAFIIDNPCPFMAAPRAANMMLSVVMPGHRIEPHRDILADDWMYRVHVPLVTNPATKFIIDGEEYEMWAGYSYRVNISREHSVVNNGKTPRIHFMFDCYED